MDERSGRLSERVRFEGRSAVRGEAGETLGDWTLRFERWARVDPIPRAERSTQDGDTRHLARRWLITMRDGVSPNLEMRIVWRGQALMPTGVDADPAMPGWLRIWAEDARG